MKKRTLWSFTFGCILLPATVLCQGDSTARQTFLRCYVNQPALDVLEQRLEKALSELEGTEVEDDVLLALASTCIQTKKYKQAIELLDKVRHDSGSTTIDLSLLGRGGVSTEEMRILIARSVSPDRSSDHALLLLSRVYRDQGNPDEAWMVLEELRKKYPKGDRVDEDCAVVESLKEKCAHGDQPLSALATEATAYRPRPHLIGLREQILMCRENGKYSGQLLELLAEVVEFYQAVLAKEEVTQFANQGLDLIRKESADTQTGKRKRQQEIFSQALKSFRDLKGPKGRAFRVNPCELTK